MCDVFSDSGDNLLIVVVFSNELITCPLIDKYEKYQGVKNRT